MNKFQVSFIERKKYNPATRTIGVETMSAPQALFWTQQRFGKKNINIISVVDENGMDFLKPVQTSENELSGTINASADMDDIKITMMPDGNVSAGSITTTNNSDTTTLEIDSESPEGMFDGFSQVIGVDGV